MRKPPRPIPAALLRLGTLCALLAAAFAATAQPTADCPDVRTVVLAPATDAMALPVIALEADTRLCLQFDLLADEPLPLRCSIVHLDAQGRPDGLDPTEFFTGPATMPVESYEFSFTTTVPYVHYRHEFPDRFSRFTHSGNYMLRVGLDDGSDSLLFCRPFYVTEQAARIDVGLAQPYDGHALRSRQQVNATVSSRTLRLEPQYLTLVAQQNRRTDNRRTLPFSGYDADRLCYRDRPANIFDGANTFRFFDMSNLRAAIYNIRSVERYGGETFVMLKPEAVRAGSHYAAEAVLAGGMKVNIQDRANPDLEADYAWVSFSLPMAQPMIDGTVHIVGDLTGWRLDSTSRMDYNPQFRAYTKRLLLKQGYYAYQLLFLPARPGAEAETARLEGDHRETPNRYTLFLYQRTPADRADRLIAVGQAN